MAEVAELQTINPNSLAYGADTYRGTFAISFRKQKPPRIPIIKEGELQASAYEQVPSDQPPVTGTIRSRSETVLLTLAEQAGGGDLTAGYKEAGTSNNRTKTFTGFEPETGDGNITRNAVGEYSLSFRALTVTTAAVI